MFRLVGILAEAEGLPEFLAYLTRTPNIGTAESDLYEYFMYQGAYFLTFHILEAESLEAKLEENAYDLRERIRIGEALLHSLLLKQMPWYFAAGGLLPGHVMLTDSFEIGFQYDLVDLKNAKRYSVGEVALSLAYWMETLFRKELRQKLDEELTSFWKMLKRDECYGLPEMIQAYRKLSVHLNARLDTEGKLRSKTIPAMCLKWWNAHKRVMVKTAAILILCVVVCLSVYGYGYYRSLTQRRSPHFTAIGTVELK
jgi:hypothetical protein